MSSPAPAGPSRPNGIPAPARRLSNPAELQNIDQPVHPVNAFIKHGKYVALGGAGCWWTDLFPVAADIRGGTGGWARNVLRVAVGLHGLTVLIFLYLVLFLPWFRGYIPHYPRWQQSARLRVLVPLLTASILSGWTCFVVALSQAPTPATSSPPAVHRQPMGIVSAMAAATSLFVLTLGVLGLIPAPRNVPVRKKAA